jgi:Outer membrane protein beta-barrel domain
MMIKSVTASPKKWTMRFGIVALCGFMLLSSPAFAQDAETSTWKVGPGVLLAQAEGGGDDSYDPFADYSEFEESQDEEEDINFFRNGRLLTVGFIGGYRGWTGKLGSLYTGNPAFGLFMSYFFDLRFALQFAYLTSDHTITINDPNFQAAQGNVSLSDISFNLKYYFNTQNVTRGLADLNPYVIGGFSQIYRTQTVSGYPEFAKDSAFAVNMGVGLEIPMMRNKMYFGGQLMYQYIAFADENKFIEAPNGGGTTSLQPSGDAYMALAILGVNF